MQLASTTDNQESSETQPILNHHCEIIPITATTTTDHHHHHHDIENIDESSRLVVNVDHPQCRICLDLGGEDLIAPCHCKGTQKYVHRSCLDNWRSTKVVTSSSLLSLFIHVPYAYRSFSFPRRALLFLTVQNAELSS